MDSIVNDRVTINSIDTQIRKLLEQRFNIVKEIGNFKKKNQIAIYDKNRESKIYNDINIENSIYKKYIIKIYNAILTQSYDLQQNIKC